MFTQRSDRMKHMPGTRLTLTFEPGEQRRNSGRSNGAQRFGCIIGIDVPHVRRGINPIVVKRVKNDRQNRFRGSAHVLHGPQRVEPRPAIIAAQAGHNYRKHHRRRFSAHGTERLEREAKCGVRSVPRKSK